MINLDKIPLINLLLLLLYSLYNKSKDTQCLRVMPVYRAALYYILSTSSSVV